MPSPQVSDFRTDSRIVRGPGSAKVLSASSLFALMQQRLNDPEWYTHRWNGVNLIQTAAAAGADLVFDLQGTSAVNGDVTFNAEGPGLNLETFGGDNDQDIAVATLSGVYSTTAFWDTALEPGIVAVIRTGPDAGDIDNARLFCGLKLTATDDPATDADQAFFVYDAASSTAAANWRAWTEINSVVDNFNTGEVVAANTRYLLGVLLDQGRRPHYYLGKLVSGRMTANLIRVGAAVRALTTILPMFGIAARGEAAGKEFQLLDAFVCQRKYAR